MAKQPERPVWASQKWVTENYSMSKTTLWRRVKEGKITSTKVDGRRRYEVASVESYVAGERRHE